jgi:hypothetical protein
MGHEIEYPGTPIEHLYFVEGGMASQTVTLMDGPQVEVGMFGYESVIGVSALMGTKQSLNRVYTQIEGHGYYYPIQVARKEFHHCGQSHSLALRYVQAQLVQTMQSAACNAKACGRSKTRPLAAHLGRPGTLQYIQDVARVSCRHARKHPP